MKSRTIAKPTDLMEHKRSSTAAICLQAHMRGYLTRKHFRLTQLKKLENYPVIALGIGPEIKGLEKHKSVAGSVALVAMSGLRPLLLACELADGNPEIPKIFLVDNSEQVHQFWHAIKKFASEHKEEKNFTENFSSFVAKNKDLLMFSEDEDCEKIKRFIIDLFEKYKFDRVCRVLLNAVNIKQGLEDKDTFKKIKMLLIHLKIKHVYVYTSTVVADMHNFVSPALADDILANIAALDPKLSIHASLVDGEPKDIYLCEKQSPSLIKQLLGLSASPSPSATARQEDLVLKPGRLGV